MLTKEKITALINRLIDIIEQFNKAILGDPGALIPALQRKDTPNSKRKQSGAQRLQRKKSDHKKEKEFGITYDGVSALLDKPLPPYGPS